MDTIQMCALVGADLLAIVAATTTTTSTATTTTTTSATSTAAALTGRHVSLPVLLVVKESLDLLVRSSRDFGLGAVESEARFLEVSSNHSSVLVVALDLDLGNVR